MEYKTKSITIKVRPDDIVEVTNNEEWENIDTIETATENAKVLKKAVNGKKRGILSHMPDTYVGKEVLECYIKAEIGEVATALMTRSFASKVVGNIYLKLTGKKKNAEQESDKPPVKIFTKRELAEAWLLEQIALYSK
ncbi:MULTISPECIES: hypothetical protein [unclassified Aureispira]|uniref:hypothetical protein n=1 Tax=unclassified Aureispira TaxID=2649989 RepID=UPI000698BF0B|nr:MULTISPECIES: hypothetical protein [unclassified Aureispira]WMX12896.1 hypothetical protein QP953_18835 [Aureispira sp. CCB-E]